MAKLISWDNYGNMRFIIKDKTYDFLVDGAVVKRIKFMATKSGWKALNMAKKFNKLEDTCSKQS